MAIPSKVKPGDPVRASDWNALIDCVRAAQLHPGSGVRITRTASGTTLALDRSPIRSLSLPQTPFQVVQVSSGDSDTGEDPTIGVVSDSHVINSADKDAYEEDNSDWGLLNDDQTDGDFDLPDIGDKIWLRFTFDQDQNLTSIDVEYGPVGDDDWPDYPDPIEINTDDTPYQECYHQIIAEATDPDNDPRDGMVITASGSGNPDDTQPWPIGTLYVDTQANVFWMLESSGWVQIPFNPTVHYIYGGYGQVALKLDGILDVMQSTTDWAGIHIYATGGSGTCANPWWVACSGDGTTNPRGSFVIAHTGSNRFWMEPGCAALHLGTGGNVSNATFSITTATGATTMDNGKVKTDGSGNLTSTTHILTPQSAPASPNKGQIYFDNSSSHFFGWNGSAWKQLDN